MLLSNNIMNKFIMTNVFIDLLSMKREDVIKKPVPKKHVIKRSNKDTLFFCLTSILLDKSEMTFREEKQIKYDWITKIKSATTKYNKSEHYFAFYNKINIHAAEAICFIYDISIIIIIDNIFIHLNKGNTIHYINYDNQYNSINGNLVKTEHLFEIQNYNKLFYSMSHYTVSGLKEILRKICVSHEPSLRKPELYDLLIESFKLINLKINT